MTCHDLLQKARKLSLPVCVLSILGGAVDPASASCVAQVKRPIVSGGTNGVTAVAAARVPVLGGNSWGTEVRVQGFESGPDIDSSSRMNFVGPGFFGTLGMALLAGREFSASDVGDEATVAVAAAAAAG